MRFRIAIGAVIVVILASLATLPTELRPRPILSGAQVSPQVISIFERSCADCHSENTHYPWYSYVAPVSFLIRNDVTGGRRHLNLSRWEEYPIVRKERSLSEIANQVRDGDMPMPIYTWIHHGAGLSEADRQAIFAWTQAERLRLIQAK